MAEGDTRERTQERTSRLLGAPARQGLDGVMNVTAFAGMVLLTS